MSEAYVQSLARGISVLRAFDADHASMSLSEVAQKTGLTRATARRFLHTLVELGYVHADGKVFRLSPTVLGIGYSYLSSLSLPDLAYPHLRELSGRVGESTSMSVLEGDDIIYVARVHARRIMHVAISVGTSFPAHATSMGRVLLAGLDEERLEAYLERQEPEELTGHTVTDIDELRARILRVRERGWEIVDQELEMGLRSVAAPVTDAKGRHIAAVNVSMRVGTENARADKIKEKILPRLRETALRIGHAYRSGAGLSLPS
ncbi:helix-turn-helix domain-containing protein [Kocuria koreensis]|jgi:IclR family pca regulon transcriptional regulator|uniref:Helix-turn-helix domain-containing protein n=1 Tax=Rothia koreensis TaxID=592378 RepID=A0A7K1LFB3_9MICC|nr:IclR family transcriptional regulator C-terminal domain-containing protein [Rothia koreensis]MUN53773.1 helix-turn-helix domain-containing protein [Rothia koreensis]